MRSSRGAERALAVILAGALACACRDPYPHPRHRGAGATAPQGGGTLRLATSTDLGALDPAVIQDVTTGSLGTLLFDTLVEFAPGTYDLRPGLAERWTIDEGGRTLRFVLRDGVRFHDGTPVTADDVKASLERMIDPERSASWAGGQYDRIVGFDAFRAHRAAHLDGLVVIDARTVEVRLASPDASALERFTLPPAAIVPSAYVERVGMEAFGAAPVGSGPYALESWEQGTRIVLRKNPGYFRPEVARVERIVIDLNVPASTIAMRLQRSDVDLSVGYWLSPEDLVWFRQRSAWKDALAVSAIGEIGALCMNVEMPPWDNRALRRAVAHAIDREALARASRGAVAPLTTLFPPTVPGYDPQAPWAQRYDPAAARREMAEAGYPDGLPGEHEIWFLGALPRSLVLVQSDLARIGIRTRFRSAGLDYGALTRRRTAELSACGWLQDFPDPVDFAEPLFHSRSIADEGSPNVAFYANPALDALLDRARAEQDPKARLAMYAEAERTIAEDAPWAFLDYATRTDVVNPYVRDYHVGTAPSLDLRGVWLDDPRRDWSAP